MFVVVFLIAFKGKLISLFGSVLLFLLARFLDINCRGILINSLFDIYTYIYSSISFETKKLIYIYNFRGILHRHLQKRIKLWYRSSWKGKKKLGSFARESDKNFFLQLNLKYFLHSANFFSPQLFVSGHSRFKSIYVY